jgi:hypothetical protein
MNRSILIVICDFLLVSLLAFSTVDINKTTQEGVPRQVKTTISTNLPDSSKQDLTAVMRLALEQERKGRDMLMGELNRTRDALARQQSLVSEREQQAKALQQEIQRRELQTAQLQQQTAQLEQQTAQLEEQHTNLLQQFASAQTNIITLSHQLQSTSTEAVISKEKLAALQAELRKQAEQANALQQRLGYLAESNQMVLAEKQRLAGQLQVAEAEKRIVTEQVSRMQEEVKVERAEKAKLAEGVKVLAARSDQLTQAIQQNRPLAPNTIFNEFLTNRVDASFWAVRTGFLGREASKRMDTHSVLVTDGTNTVALCHVQDTPLTFGYPGTDWEGLTGTLVRNEASIAIGSVSFYQLDPRILFMPVTPAEIGKLGGKVYRMSSDPYKFQDAVVVGAQEAYYGECAFQIDPSTPLYVKMDRNSIKGLFGKFNPSRGDLVFSRTGEVLGVMANNTYCMMIKNFNPTATIQFAQDVRGQQTGETLARLYSLIAGLPSKLQ